MLKWNSRIPPYRVRIPDYVQVPAGHGRVGLVVGERRGVDGLGPLVAVLLDGAASSTVAAIKADCTVLESSGAKKITALTPLLEPCLEWRGPARSSKERI